MITAIFFQLKTVLHLNIRCSSFLPAAIGLALCVSSLLILASATAWAETPQSIEIIRRADAIRNPERPFSTTIEITEYQHARAQDSMIVTIRSKQAQQSGQFRTLVGFIKPLRDRGKLMLRNGNEVWFYDPAGQSSVRISPQQRLLGQAANGDIMTANFSLDYNMEPAQERSILDADRQQRDTWLVTMHAKPTTQNVSYDTIEYWVERQTFRPIMGRFYSLSKRLLKQAYYRGYSEQLGTMRPTEVIIIDGVDTSKVTLMTFSAFAYTDIPEEWLQRSFLPHFKGE